MFCSVERIKEQGHKGRGLPARSRTSEIASFSPFQSSWRLSLWFQRKTGISKNEHAQPSFLLNINREVPSNKAYSLLPSLAKGNRGLMLKGGKHTFSTGNSQDSSHRSHCPPFHLLFGLKSGKTTQKVSVIRSFQQLSKAVMALP